MELKTHSVVRIIADEDPQEGVRFVEHYEVIKANNDTGMAVLRRLKATKDQIVQCPHCGSWGPADDQVVPKGKLV